MAVFTRDEAWWIDYYVEGRRKRERIGGPLTKAMKKVAADTLSKRRVEIAEGKYLDKRKVPRCTFNELADQYLGWAKTHHRGFESTMYRVETFRKEFGPKQVSEITPRMVDTYVEKRSAGLQPASVNREIGILRHMFVKAKEWAMATSNPVEHFRRLRVQNRRLRFLSLEEIDRLLSVADGVLRPILVTALHAGLRRGELFSLQWDDLDFPNGVIRVVDTKGGERREIPMSDTLRETLRRIPRRLDSLYVFPGKLGKELVNIRRRFLKALDEAGIEGFVFHDLRHTFASHLVMAGVDLMTVKEFLGHKRFEMTLRYAHLAPDHKRAAINRLDTSMDTRQKERATASAVTL
ncbi:MAG: tyrosine-type recombinase/integrase [Nitrospinota bacterium]|nr:tyrosine-type recombinase/integrase [Nitrospinota bacterium]